MKPVGFIHDRFVFGRRVGVLSGWFAELIPQQATLLDVGCGSGLLAQSLLALRPDLVLEGADVLVRPQTHIPVRPIDGSTLPYPDRSFQAILLADVLHHANNPLALLREACRVSRELVIIKDHEREGVFAGARLRFMDWFGNARFGVNMPYNYWTHSQWVQAWQELGLTTERVERKLHLYPPPFDSFFGASLHFIAMLRKRDVP